MRRRSPAAGVLRSGLAALADVTGGARGVLRHRRRRHAHAPGRRLVIRRAPDGWTVQRGRPRPVQGPAVEAPADLLLEAAAGRINPVPAVAARRLKVHEPAGLLKLAPIVQAVPGIPGGPILQLAARTVGGAGGLLGRLFGKG